MERTHTEPATTKDARDTIRMLSMYHAIPSPDDDRTGNHQISLRKVSSSQTGYISSIDEIMKRKTSPSS